MIDGQVFKPPHHSWYDQTAPHTPVVHLSALVLCPDVPSTLGAIVGESMRRGRTDVPNRRSSMVIGYSFAMVDRRAPFSYITPLIEGGHRGNELRGTASAADRAAQPVAASGDAPWPWGAI